MAKTAMAMKNKNNPKIRLKAAKLETATFGAGCFWCVEAIFQRLNGVVSVESGYSGGDMKNPSYKAVCSGATGHAEVIQIKFDPEKISYKELLKVFFSTHDPTTVNRQGSDAGSQYRSVIFYHDDEQKKAAEKTVKDLEKAKVWDKPIVTGIKPFNNFYKAEDYHQNYYNEHKFAPYCVLVVRPKLKKFEELLKNPKDF